MFNLTEIYERLEERRKVLKWVISGVGSHGFKISDAYYLEWWWITKHYNVNDFKCKHIKVSEIGMVVTLHGKEYDGYCESCEKQVWGIIRHDGNKEGWGWI